MKQTGKKGSEISYVDTVGGTPNAFGDIDSAASLEQVPSVYKDPSPTSKEAIAGRDIDEGHGGENQVRIVKPASDSITMHDSIGEQPDCAGSLIRPTKEYSHGGEFKG